LSRKSCSTWIGLALLLAGAPGLGRAQEPLGPDVPTVPLQPGVVPPPLPPRPQPQFFYDDGGKPAGPFDLAGLEAKVAGGAIGPGTLVWKSGTPNWVAAKDLAEISPSFHPAIFQHQVAGRTFFLGTWETDGPGPIGIGQARMVLTLGGDGKVDGHYLVSLVGSSATKTIPVGGSWSVAAVSDKVANLTLALVVQGDNGQHLSVNSTTRLEIVDQNTVRDTAQGTVSKRVKQ
jgi:hypothetical protein